MELYIIYFSFPYSDVCFHVFSPRCSYYSVYTLNRPDNRALPYIFLDWESFCCLVQNPLCLLPLCICFILILSNMWVLPYLWCSPSWNAPHYQEHLSSLCNTHIFVVLSCPLHDPPYINNSVPCPTPLPESCLFHCISCSIYCSSCFWIILHRT